MDTSTYVLPATAMELVATVTCPADRLVLVSQVGKRRLHLPRQWVELRLSDWGVLLANGWTQAQLADLTGLSRARVCQLSAKARRECPA